LKPEGRVGYVRAVVAPITRFVACRLLLTAGSAVVPRRSPSRVTEAWPITWLSRVDASTAEALLDPVPFRRPAGPIGAGARTFISVGCSPACFCGSAIDRLSLGLTARSRPDSYQRRWSAIPSIAATKSRVPIHVNAKAPRLARALIWRARWTTSACWTDETVIDTRSSKCCGTIRPARDSSANDRCGCAHNAG
jgi:hypothetical protein